MEFRKVKIVSCRAKPNYHVWIRFDDGLEGEVDLSELLTLRKKEAFLTVSKLSTNQSDRFFFPINFRKKLDLGMECGGLTPLS